MANNTELNLDLASLVKLTQTGGTVTAVDLYYEVAEIVYAVAPQAQLGSSTVRSIWIAGVRYEGVTAWTRAWNSAVAQNLAQGTRIRKGRPPAVTAVNLATSTGARLATTVNQTQSTANNTTVNTVITNLGSEVSLIPGPQGPQGAQGQEGAQGPQGVQGVQGLPGLDAVGIQSLAINDQGNLTVIYTDSIEADLGRVRALQPTFAVGTVTTGAAPAVSVTGGPLEYTLNFTLQAGPAGPGSGDVSTESLYSDPVWITSLASTKITGLSASSVGLGNVTNESKATMFTSPTFTGTVSGVTATMVGLGNVTNESKATMFADAALTGTPTAPTATAGTNTTQLATTAFVSSAITTATGSLGTMSTQNANAVAITGGTISGTTINTFTVGSNSVGTRTVSTAAPSGGVDGDIWYRV